MACHDCWQFLVEGHAGEIRDEDFPCFNIAYQALEGTAYIMVNDGILHHFVCNCTSHWYKVCLGNKFVSPKIVSNIGRKHWCDFFWIGIFYGLHMAANKTDTSTDKKNFAQKYLVTWQFAIFVLQTSIQWDVWLRRIKTQLKANNANTVKKKAMQSKTAKTVLSFLSFESNS